MDQFHALLTASYGRHYLAQRLAIDGDLAVAARPQGDDPVLEALRTLDLTGMSPEDVLSHVRQWQADLK